MRFNFWKRRTVKREPLLNFTYKSNEQAYLDKTILNTVNFREMKDVSQYTEKCYTTMLKFFNTNFVVKKERQEYIVINPYRLYWLIKLHEVLVSGIGFEELLLKVVRVLLDKEEKRYINIKLIVEFLEQLNLRRDIIRNTVINYETDYTIALDDVVNMGFYNNKNVYDNEMLVNFIRNEKLKLAKDMMCVNPKGFLLNFNPYFKMMFDEYDSHTSGISNNSLQILAKKQERVNQYCKEIIVKGEKLLPIIGYDTQRFNNIYNSNMRTLQSVEYNKVFGDTRTKLSIKKGSSSSLTKKLFAERLKKNGSKNSKKGKTKVQPKPVKRGFFARLFRIGSKTKKNSTQISNEKP